LSAYLSAYLSDLNLSSSSTRHFLREFWLTTNDPKMDEKLSNPDPVATLNRVPHQSPKKKCFL
jgi:hypothetical protein